MKNRSKVYYIVSEKNNNIVFYKNKDGEFFKHIDEQVDSYVESSNFKWCKTKKQAYKYIIKLLSEFKKKSPTIVLDVIKVRKKHGKTIYSKAVKAYDYN